MLAKIFYEQAHPIEGKELKCPSTELIIMHLSRAFGGCPCELDKSHLDILKGMEATWIDVAENPYSEIIRAIKRLGAIKIWPEW